MYVGLPSAREAISKFHLIRKSVAGDMHCISYSFLLNGKIKECYAKFDALRMRSIRRGGNL